RWVSSGSGERPLTPRVSAEPHRYDAVDEGDLTEGAERLASLLTEAATIVSVAGAKPVGSVTNGRVPYTEEGARWPGRGALQRGEFPFGPVAAAHVPRSTAEPEERWRQ